eukprot:g9032.t1
MSWSVRDEAGAREFFDPPEAVQAGARRVAQYLRTSTHAIAFTGAGISTAAGADYERRNPVRSAATKGDPTRPRVDLDGMLRKRPTYTHRALAALVERGYLKTILTQNVDNLHRKSGVPRAHLVELHGNLQCEVCASCGREYERAFRVGPNLGAGQNRHFSGRRCDAPACGGYLKDYLVPFGEDLPKSETARAYAESDRADLCLAIGSSLTVTPACDYAGWVSGKVKRRLEPWKGSAEGRLAIVNIQKTPYDNDADVVLHTFCDDALRMVMEELNLADAVQPDAALEDEEN